MLENPEKFNKDAFLRDNREKIFRNAYNLTKSFNESKINFTTQEIRGVQAIHYNAINFTYEELP